MVNFKELFQPKNEKKIINMFKDKFYNLSKDEFKKFINYKDSDGNTLLHHAYNNRCNELAEFLYKNNIGNEITNSGFYITTATDSDYSDEQFNKINNHNEHSISSEDNTILSDNQIGGNKLSDKKLLSNNSTSIKNSIKYTKHKKDVYIEKGKKLINYIQDIDNSSNNINKIAQIYGLNLNKPNDILLAKYKQTGLFDYIINKFPNLNMLDVHKLIKFNITKDILDQINHIKIKNKIMKYFKSLRI